MSTSRLMGVVVVGTMRPVKLPRFCQGSGQHLQLLAPVGLAIEAAFKVVFALFTGLVVLGFEVIALGPHKCDLPYAAPRNLMAVDPPL